MEVRRELSFLLKANLKRTQKTIIGEMICWGSCLLCPFAPSYLFFTVEDALQQKKKFMSAHPQTTIRPVKDDQLNPASEGGSSSSFSLSKIRRSNRGTPRKRVIRFVHTFCFFRLSPDGNTEKIYYQLASQSALNNQARARNAARREAAQEVRSLATRALTQLGQQSAIKVEERGEDDEGVRWIGWGCFC